MVSRRSTCSRTRKDISPMRTPIPPSPMQPWAKSLKPPLKMRFYHWLGFSNRRAAQPTTPEFTNGFHRDWFTVATVTMFTWRERFLILISGRVLYHHALKTDKKISKSNSTTAISVLPPGFLPDMRGGPSQAELRRMTIDAMRSTPKPPKGRVPR